MPNVEPERNEPYSNLRYLPRRIRPPVPIETNDILVTELLEDVAGCRAELANYLGRTPLDPDVFRSLDDVAWQLSTVAERLKKLLG